MSWTLLELLPELLHIAGYSLVASLLTVLGVGAELESWHTFAVEGLSVMTLWYAFMGAAILYAAVYLVGYEQLLPRVRRVVAD
ncbi:hypothetical protein [Haloarchaeobius iranensis]|uniref:DUF8151 domain-containing protein n=1 Tax=Haloarchaeobius iranensis TaxID=996166 RepID=A0A1G9SH39_9EURY|nr:hypothetical protein [Haloarchaeobius iranensis]SDM34721.1 hypothetical protein SAMN05192554_101185 [Haloarchaeobius iranensis]